MPIPSTAGNAANQGDPYLFQQGAINQQARGDEVDPRLANRPDDQLNRVKSRVDEGALVVKGDESKDRRYEAAVSADESSKAGKPGICVVQGLTCYQREM